MDAIQPAMRRALVSEEVPWDGLHDVEALEDSAFLPREIERIEAFRQGH